DLTGDVLSNELGIQLRLANFLDVDVNRHAQHLGGVATQPIEIFAPPANHDARTTSVNGDARMDRSTHVGDFPYGGLLRTLCQKATLREVVVQLVGIGAALGVPDRGMVFDDTQSDACWIDFLTHLVDSYFSATLTVMWQVRFRMRSARPLARGRMRLSVIPSSTQMVETRSSSMSMPLFSSAFAMADCSTFLTSLAAFFGEKVSRSSASATGLPRT